MTYRADIDKRLKLVSQAVTSEAEWSEIDDLETYDAYDIYAGCGKVLEIRGTIGNELERLKALALAYDNINITLEGVRQNIEKTNIFLGARLES